MDKALDTMFYQNEAKDSTDRYEFEKAIVNYKRLIRMDPKGQDHHYWWARNLDGQEKYRLAELKFREALTFDPEDFYSLNSMGILISKQGKYDEAISLFHRALKNPPENNSLFLNLAITLTKKGDYEEALEWYRKGLEKNRNDDYIHNAIGYLYFLQGNYAEAILQFDNALQIDSYYEIPHFNKAIIYFLQSGMEEESKIAFGLGIKSLTGGYQHKLHKLREAVSIYNGEMDRVQKELKRDDLEAEVRVKHENVQKGFDYILSLLKIEVEKFEKLLRGPL